MSSRIRLGILLALAAVALAGCDTIKPATAPALKSGSANFSVYAALGTSIAAGTQSSGLVNRHQTHAYSYLFARQVGAAKFDQPLVDQDGIPALLTLKSLSPLIINNIGRVQGTNTNAALATAYHDMGIPFAILPDCADSTLYYNTTQGRALYFNLIQRHRGTPLLQIATQLNPPPTFVTFEYGANEVLGPATNGSGTASVPSATWAAVLHGTLDALQALIPGVKVAIFTVPDPTDVPFVRTLPAVQLGANGQPKQPIKPLLGAGSGPGGTLVPGQDLIMLDAGPMLAVGVGYAAGDTAYGAGVPIVATGVPLPDSTVLSALEVVQIQTTVAAYNAAVRSEAAARGFAVVDLYTLLRQARTTGYVVAGTKYTSAFITGGLFSYDAVHPNDLAHGLLCNELIRAVNVTYGSSIPDVDLSSAATTRADRAGQGRDDRVLAPLEFPGSPLADAVFPWRPGVMALR